MIKRNAAMLPVVAEEIRAYLRTFIQPGDADPDAAIHWEECRWWDGYQGPACQLCNQPLQLSDLHLARHADVAAMGGTRFPICGECRRVNGGDPDFVIATPVLPGQLSLMGA